MAERHVNDARIVKRGEGDFHASIDWDEDGERTTETKKFASFDEANQWLVEQEAPIQTDVAPVTEPIDTTKDNQPAVGSGESNETPTSNPVSAADRDPEAAAANSDLPAAPDTTQQEAASNNQAADNEQLAAETDAANAEQEATPPADQNS